MRWKFLLKPSWLLLTLVVFSFTIACFILLSPWQFGRNDERVAQNSALANSLITDPKPLAQLLPAEVAPNDKNQWQLASIDGTYLPQNEVVARLRTVQGEAAFEVLTPFRTTDGTVLLVDRGYLKPDDKSFVLTRDSGWFRTLQDPGLGEAHCTYLPLVNEQ